MDQQPAPALDTLAHEVARYGDNAAILDILEDVCALTHMGFAAVARVTEDRWIACQVLDQIEFGLTAGGELDVSTTICDDIRKTGVAIVIDHVAYDENWNYHPTPSLYGFQSYVSIPLVLNGEFFGTLCAIDPNPNLLSSPEILDQLNTYAHRVEEILAAI